MLIKAKPCYLIKSVFRRPDFPSQMTDEEKAIIQKHSDFWDKLILEGSAIVAGSVQDPEGAYGLAIIFSDSKESARRLLQNDPLKELADYQYIRMFINFDEKY